MACSTGQEDAQAGNVLGGIMMVVGAVIALKGVFIVNLVATMAQITAALAAAVPVRHLLVT
jgi:hypothetical protein